MRRYTCDNVYEEESEDGEWVRYEDHVAELALLMGPLVEPKQPSDPKHLPPRDCLVLIECPDGYSAQPVFVHVLFEEESGDYDEEGRICGHADRWMDAVEGEEIDPSRVITWRELPEVE